MVLVDLIVFQLNLSIEYGNLRIMALAKLLGLSFFAVQPVIQFGLILYIFGPQCGLIPALGIVSGVGKTPLLTLQPLPLLGNHCHRRYRNSLIGKVQPVSGDWDMGYSTLSSTNAASPNKVVISWASI